VLSAVTADPVTTHVIDHDEQDVGFGGSREGGADAGEEDECEEFHGGEAVGM